MSTDAAPDIDREAIAEAAQRAAERAALKKVRKAIDRAEDAQAHERTLLRRALLFCTGVVVLALIVLACVMLSSREREQGPLPIPTAQKK